LQVATPVVALIATLVQSVALTAPVAVKVTFPVGFVVPVAVVVEVNVVPVSLPSLIDAADVLTVVVVAIDPADVTLMPTVPCEARKVVPVGVKVAVIV
jgi:hypothetical protein